jgi:hypothetical protein
MTRLLRTWIVVSVVAATALPAQEPGNGLPYTATLTYGTGLVNIPVAWISPINGEIWFAGSFRSMSDNSFGPNELWRSRDRTLNIDAHFLGRFSVGGSLYSLRNEQVGAFAQALLLRAGNDAPRWLPSVAAGVRGIGVSARQDRLVTGTERIRDALGASAPGDGRIKGAPTLYGVATKEFGTATTALGITAGFGTGLFRNDADMDTLYNPKGGTGGLFGGIRLSRLFAGGDVQLSAVAESDAWDVNAGVVAVIKHWQVGILATELDEGSRTAAGRRLAGWTKVNLLVGYNGSIPAILQGTRQRAELTELDLEAQALRREVAQRERRRQALEREIAGAQRKADAMSSTLQSALQKQLDAEREAIKKASDRLDTVQKTGKPPEGR